MECDINLFRRIRGGDALSGEEALALAEGRFSFEELSVPADALRRHFFGNRISLCTIVNAKSGACDMDCRFCSQSRAAGGGKAGAYPLVGEDKIAGALDSSRSSSAGRCGIVTSGGRLSRTDIRSLGSYLERAEPGDVDVCASFGRLKREDLLFLRERGVSRIHHNLESSRNFYPRICSTQSWDSRLETVKEALALGFTVCSGGLFGMGEGWEDRIDLALTLRSEGIDNIPLNFLIPQPGSPLEDRAPLGCEEALKIIALYRLLLPEGTLRICGGRIQTFGDRQGEIFRAGANAMMTGDYLTSRGGSPEEDLRMLEQLDLEVVPG